MVVRIHQPARASAQRASRCGVLLGVRALLVLVVAGCHAFDPLADVRHREVADTEAAIRLILDENPPPRVFAIGEYHQRRGTAGESPTSRFSREVLHLLEPRARHLVLESWVADACRAKTDLAQQLDHPATQQMELLRVWHASRQLAVQPHELPMTCIEQDALFDARPRVIDCGDRRCVEPRNIDFLLVLEVITQKLHDSVRALADADPDHAVIVYGGALHNDLYPRWPLEELSYALPLQRELGDRAVLEIDLVVPEVVAPLRMVRDEPWFPLMARASPARAIVWRRGPSSYVVILPAQSEQVARVAQPEDVM